jgi:uncharacterized protein (UPF0276 family)
MIKLTTNLSDPLIELLHNNDAPIDAIEVGPWLSPKKILYYRKNLPNLPFYFHGCELINRIYLVPGAVSMVNNYLKTTESPWLSMHITFLLPGVRSIFVRRGWRIPSINPDRATQGFVQKVRKLSHNITVPVLLENPDPIPISDNYEIQPERITDILEATNCGLLLDIGHARLSAEVIGMKIEDYIEKIPLNRINQVHVSGPRIRNGRHFDAHESLQQIDYELLDFVLNRSKPQVVTLEYIRNIDALREQLTRLRSIINFQGSMR